MTESNVQTKHNLHTTKNVNINDTKLKNPAYTTKSLTQITAQPRIRKEAHQHQKRYITSQQRTNTTKKIKHLKKLLRSTKQPIRME
jgi:hypothetical protein